MGKEEQIRNLLKKMASEVGPSFSMVAQVKSVDEPNLVCDLFDEESNLDFHDVLLRPVIDGSQSLTVIPKVNSWVLAIRLEDSDDWTLIYVCEVEKYHLTCDHIVFNGGGKGGLLNWTDAKAQHDLVKSFIQKVKQVCSNPITEPGNGALSAFQQALNGAIGSLDVPSFENLVDDRVKH